MKKTQRDPVPKIEEFEDLTLFANESFDTQDVDLFEFSSEESSPLTRLKSIILSLDWEINDEILQELAEELTALQSMWRDDKVAEVYLQGLSKIGSYIRAKGAYAHPNSIKLLLTFFYNFEKIISSQHITGEEITQLLKGDVRKFKILQYQIKQSEADSPTSVPSQAPEVVHVEGPATPTAESEPSKQLKAAILSLDWEVTDENLQQFNQVLTVFHNTLTGNKPAFVLVQGLQALGDYIADERANAHPEAFTLLHAFQEALEQITHQEQAPLDHEQVQNLLVDRINRLNTLKMLIVEPAGGPVDEQRLDEVFDEMSTPVAEMALSGSAVEQAADEFPAPAFADDELSLEISMDDRGIDKPADALELEIDTLFAMDAKPAMETADTQYPDEILPPDAIQPVDDELADDFIEAHLGAARGLMPALSDTDEALSGFNEDAEPLDLPAQSDLAEQLDFLFAEADEDEEPEAPSPEAAPIFALPLDDEQGEEPVAALADFELTLDDGADSAADLVQGNDTPEERALPTAEIDPNVLEIQSKLDSFFADAEDEAEEMSATAEETAEEIEQSLFFAEEDTVPAALADSTEERGFSEEEEVAALQYTPMKEIEEKLDFFFGADVEEELDSATEPLGDTARSSLLEEDAFLAALNGIEEEEVSSSFAEPAPEPTIAPALDGFALAETHQQIAAIEDQAGPDLELEDALDAFFDRANEEAAEPGQDTAAELAEVLETAVAASEAEPLATGKEVVLAALGALLPGVVRAPNREKLTAAAEQLTALRTAGLSLEQQSLAQLLETVVSMLVRLPTSDEAATEKLINYLYERLLARQCAPETLPEAIGRFTAWLQQASAIMPVVPAASGQEDPSFAYTAKELYFELGELRAHIREEFAKLRHELHHHQG